MRQLIYIGQTPSEGTGSTIIILRHLRRLAANGNWRITIIAEPGQDTTACTAEGWTVHTLPTKRRWYWPPYRPSTSSEYLRNLRTKLIAREVIQLLTHPSETENSKLKTVNCEGYALAAYLAAHSDFSAEIASHVAEKTGIPLSLIIHDDAAAFAKTDAEKKRLRQRHARILARAHRNHFVSPELAAAYTTPHSSVLLPIPEGGSREPAFRETQSVRPRIYYAGHIWPAQYPLLSRLAKTIEAASARLVILSRDTPELRTFLATNPADWQRPFESNRDALAHLKANASGLLASYTDTLEEMPWIATSYPSKFIEYAHLGLPIAIVAPRDSAINRWAARENYPHAFTNERPPAFTSWLATLRNPITWAATAAPAHRLALTTFDPERIQAQWEATLLRESPALNTKLQILNATA